MKNIKSEKGFSLIETAMILVIAGILSTAFLAVLGNRYNKEKRVSHFDNVAEITQKIKDYALVSGAYPLPANPDLAPTDANYGVPVSAVPDFSAGECAPGSAPVNGVSCVLGAGESGNGTHGRVVFIGAVPTSLLGYSNERSRDMHGTIYTYAVTRSLTNAATFDDSAGEIEILSDETGTDAVGTNGDVHFVVVSHGQNHSSPYTSGGVLIAAEQNALKAACDPSCPTGFQPLAGEEENLDNDSTFWVLTAGADGFPGTENIEILSTTREVGNGGYFDDAVGFETSLFGREWTARGTDNVNMTMTIPGLAEGNGRVLIGASSFQNTPNYNETFVHPTNGSSQSVKKYDKVEYGNGHSTAHDNRPQLWVDGSLKADEALSQRVCDQYQFNCFKIEDIALESETIAGKSLRCIARGLKEVKVTGVSTNINAAKRGGTSEADGTCEVNTRVASDFTFGSETDGSVTCANGAKGFDSDGKMICK